jgi:hypothetical protein
MLGHLKQLRQALLQVLLHHMQATLLGTASAAPRWRQRWQFAWLRVSGR